MKNGKQNQLNGLLEEVTNSFKTNLAGDWFMRCTKCLKKEINKATTISQNMLCDDCFNNVEIEGNAQFLWQQLD